MHGLQYTYYNIFNRSSQMIMSPTQTYQNSEPLILHSLYVEAKSWADAACVFTIDSLDYGSFTGIIKAPVSIQVGLHKKEEEKKRISKDSEEASSRIVLKNMKNVYRYQVRSSKDSIGFFKQNTKHGSPKDH